MRSIYEMSTLEVHKTPTNFQTLPLVCNCKILIVLALYAQCLAVVALRDSLIC